MFLAICSKPALCICGEAYCGLKEGEIEDNLVREEGEEEMIRTNKEMVDDERKCISSMQIEEEQELLHRGLVDKYYYSRDYPTE